MQTSHFFKNVEGLNVTDSPFFVSDGQATGGYNYDYSRTGGITKVLGLTKLNTAANAQLNTLGVGVHYPLSGTKTVLRAAGTKIQTFNASSYVFANLAQDTAVAPTDFLSPTSTQPVVFIGSSTASLDMTWLAGGGMVRPYGFNGTSITENGVAAPTGTFTAVNQGSGTGGAWGTATGVYYYALGLRKTSTQALSNAALDQTITIASATDSVLLTLPTGVDATLYDRWYIYRSSVGGVAAFTAGSIVATLPITATTFTDLNVTFASSQNIPRAGNTLLDNSQLPTATSGVYSLTASAAFVASNLISYTVNCTAYTTTYATSSAATLAAVAAKIATNVNVLSAFSDGNRTITIYGLPGTVISLTALSVTLGASQATLAFTTTTGITTLGNYNSLASYKRRLVAASGNTVYFSDPNKGESWPVGLTITPPSGGPITGLSVIGYNTNDGITDEYLVIFKERETWVVTGTTDYDATTGLYDVALKFVDNVGCATQSLVVRANGYVCWVDYRGIYMWNGQGKPVYCSRLIESMFAIDGALDKTKLARGWGMFSRRKNQVIWTLSDRTLGTNRLQVKLDLRLSSPRTAEGILAGVVVSEAVIMLDNPGIALHAGAPYLPSNNEEAMLVGDASGFIYSAYSGVSNAGAGIAFSYQTKAFDFGSPALAKQFNKVVVYIDRSTSADLTLNYWAGYRVATNDQSTVSASMATNGAISGSLWDLAVWDESQWDEYSNSVVPLVFNLNSAQNNNQGDALMLKFSQGDSSVPVTIHGFTVFWDELTARK